MDLTGRMNATMHERFNVAGAQLAKLYGRPDDETALFRQRATEVANNEVERALVLRYFVTAMTLLSSLAAAAVYGWGGVLTICHAIDLGTLVALISYLARLYVPITGLSNVQVTVMTALVSFERVFELLDLTPTIREKPDAKPLPAGPARIAFSNVSFRYPTADEVSLASLETVAAPCRKNGDWSSTGAARSGPVRASRPRTLTPATGGAFGRRQDDHYTTCAAALRCAGRRGHDQRHGRA